MLKFISCPLQFPPPLSCISIHLMLKFIVNAIQSVQDKYQFQYISCWSLSKLSCPFGRLVNNFNTSHVEVYPSVSHTSDFFITLFSLYFQSFTDFYQPMTLYYFRYLVLHKSFVFTTLFHISCFHHLVKFPYSFFISISSI